MDLESEGDAFQEGHRPHEQIITIRVPLSDYSVLKSSNSPTLKVFIHLSVVLEVIPVPGGRIIPMSFIAPSG